MPIASRPSSDNKVQGIGGGKPRLDNPPHSSTSQGSPKRNSPTAINPSRLDTNSVHMSRRLIPKHLSHAQQVLWSEVLAPAPVCSQLNTLAELKYQFDPLTPKAFRIRVWRHEHALLKYARALKPSAVEVDRHLIECWNI